MNTEERLFDRLTMHVPSLQEAHHLLAEAEAMNHGPWANHCRYAADAARRIAERHPDLDANTAETLGCFMTSEGEMGFPVGDIQWMAIAS